MHSIKIIGVLIAAAVLAGVLAGARPSGAAFPGSNGKIAFVSLRDGNYEIYVMNADGSGQTNLTNNPSFDADPAWSPDGTKIVFTSGRDLVSEVYVMNVDGTGVTRLTNDTAFEEQPAWSPDGGKIVFQRADGIWVMNSHGGGQTRLTADAIHPAWSPDGPRIAFARSLLPFDYDILTMNPAGTEQTNLTNSPGNYEDLPNWSPDGTRIAFRRLLGGFKVFVMNADGSGQTNLTNSPGDDTTPSWSPDGAKIAFSSDRDGNNEIYAMDADGSAQVRLTINTAIDFAPDWQPLPATSVVLDIKPGGEPNSVNLGSGGVIPVAILTTGDFDATTVDPGTVCFGDAEAPAERDCSEKHGRGHIEDVDDDGDQDMVLHYETAQTGIDPGDTQACLTGETFDGTRVDGCDAIRIVPR